MFEFLGMAGNYDDRKIDRFEAEWGFVSTVKVNDSSQPYETAVQHESYNNGSMVIVEGYDTKSEAISGHSRWIKTMTAEQLPKTLTDKSAATVAEFCDSIGSSGWRVKSKQK